MSPAFDPSSSSTAARPTARGAATWIHVVVGEPDAAAPAAPSSSPSPIPLPELAVGCPPSGPAAEGASPAFASRSPLPPEGDGSGGGNAAGKMAWNFPTNAASDREAGSCMGADWPVLESWPALSKSTVAIKLASSEPSNAPANGSHTAPVGSVIPTPRPKTNFDNPNPNHSSSPSLAVPVRQKSSPKSNSMKRSGGASSSVSFANGETASLQSSPTPEGTTQVGLEAGPSPRDYYKSSDNWGHSRDGFTPQHHGGGDRRVGYNGNGRGNNGGGGSQRHYREWAGYDWNAPRGFVSRGPHMRMPMAPGRGYSRPFMRQAPPPPPFSGMPQQVRPFVGPMVYPEVYYPASCPPVDPMRNVPFVPHQAPPTMAPAVLVNPMDHQRSKLLNQIEYYFSNDNLCKDIFLRKKMDDQGWVPISLIAGFNRVKQLTNDIQYILDTLQGSAVVEVQGEKIRRRNDWRTWILPSTLTAHVRNLRLDEGASSQNNTTGQPHSEIIQRRQSSGNLNDQMPDGNQA